MSDTKVITRDVNVRGFPLQLWLKMRAEAVMQKRPVAEAVAEACEQYLASIEPTPSGEKT